MSAPETSGMAETHFEKKIDILEDMLPDYYTWQDFFDIDEVESALAERDADSINRFFREFLESLNLVDTDFESYDFILENLGEIEKAQQSAKD